MSVPEILVSLVVKSLNQNPTDKCGEQDQRGENDPARLGYRRGELTGRYFAATRALVDNFQYFEATVGTQNGRFLVIVQRFLEFRVDVVVIFAFFVQVVTKSRHGSNYFHRKGAIEWSRSMPQIINAGTRPAMKSEVTSDPGCDCTNVHFWLND